MKSLSRVKDRRGRVDVLMYRTTERFLQNLEEYWGIAGIWDMCKPYVEGGIHDLQLGKVPTPLMDALVKVMEMRRNAR